MSILVLFSPEVSLPAFYYFHLQTLPESQLVVMLLEALRGFLFTELVSSCFDTIHAQNYSSRLCGA